MAGSRSALVVATYRYDDTRLQMLQAPQRDADALAEVLGDPAIGGFEVQTVVNERSHDISLALAEFFAQRRADDVLLVHFSCHGVKDDSGELFLAATDTRVDLLDATAVPSAYVNKVMTRSRSGCVVLLLDCCYAGAFARGMTRAGGDVDVTDRFGGRGRAVITASTALQYAFEGNSASSTQDLGAPSVFTRALVEGLRTGEADRNSDGIVSLDELYAHVHDEVTRMNPDQTPQKWLFDVAGDLHVARRATPVTVPTELPRELETSMYSLMDWQRHAVVAPLQSLLVGSHPGLALAARLALEELAENDDSMRVRQAASSALASAPAPIPVVPAAPDPTPRTDVPLDPGPPPAPRPPTHSGDSAPSGRGTGVGLRRRWLLPVAAAAVVLALVGGFLVIRDRSGPPATIPASTLLLTTKSGGPMMSFDTSTGELSPSPAGVGSDPIISPDRQWVAYREWPASSANPGTGTLPHMVRVDGSQPRGLPGTGTGTACPTTLRPTWSPDGQSLAILCKGEKGISTVGLAISSPFKKGFGWVRRDRSLCCGLTWVDDQTIVIGRRKGSSSSELVEISARTHEVGLTVPTTGKGPHDPDWSSRGLAYVAAAKRTDPGPIVVLPPDLANDVNSDGVVWTKPGNFPAWGPGGTELAYLLVDPAGVSGDRLILHTSRAPLRGVPAANVQAGALGPPGWLSR